MLAFPFAVKFKLLIAGLLLASALPGRSIASVIDSTQWPFRVPINFSFTLPGSISYTGNWPPNQPATGTIYEPAGPGSPTRPGYAWTLTRDEISFVDSLGWHFALHGYAIEAVLVLELDTLRHHITSLTYHSEINDAPSALGSCDLKMSDLIYDSLGIHSPDSDFNRHVSILRYGRTIGFPSQWSAVSNLESPGGNPTLDIFGQHLACTFRPPDTVDFGVGVAGGHKDSAIVFRNANNIPLHILRYGFTTPDDGFSLVDSNLHTIAPFDSGRIVIRFAPRYDQQYTDTLQVVTDEAFSNVYATVLTGTAKGIDPMLWPFPDTIWIKYSAFGNYSGYGWSQFGGQETRHQYTRLPSADSLFSSRFPSSQQFFTRADILRVDSTGWLLLKGDYPTDMLWLNMTLDTVNHVVLSFDLKERGYWNVDALSAEVYLKNLSYSRSSFNFRDQIIFNEITFIDYTDDYEHSYGADVIDFCCPTSLAMFGDTLRAALSCPVLMYFYPVSVNSTSDKDLTIANTSTSDIKILSYTLKGSGFQLLDTSLHDLATGGHGRIRVRFNPTQAQSYSATLTIATDEDQYAVYWVTLFGAGEAPQSVDPSPALSTHLTIEPNPAADHTTLRFIAASDLEAVTLRLYDAAARLVRTQDVGHLSEGEHEIPITLPSMDGMAFVRITAGGAVIGTVGIAVSH